MAAKLTPVQHIKQEGEKFEIRIKTLIFTQELDFTVGEEFEIAGHGGIPLKVSPREKKVIMK